VTISKQRTEREKVAAASVVTVSVGMRHIRRSPLNAGHAVEAA
jgi:hypothetical protein